MATASRMRLQARRAKAPAGGLPASTAPRRLPQQRLKDCGDKAASTTPKSVCANSNPKYADKATQGQNPLHEP